MSREYGLDYLDIYRHSITKVKFKLFLEGLRRKFPFDDILLVMDNLQLHKSGEVKDLMDELGFLYTYTPPYSPAFNGIEEVFSQAKLLIKKKRLHCLLSNTEEDLIEIINDSFHSLDFQVIAKCVSRSLAILGLNDE